MASEAKLRGNKKHLEKLDDIKIRVPKGQRDIIHAFAESKGKSLNAYVCDLIYTDMHQEEG